MEIEFDPAKDQINRAKHGISLSAGGNVVENAVERIADTRFEYGEQRFIAFGYLGSRLHVCVFTQRGEAVRIISVRKASQRERVIYG